jgi:hypothetical protein
LDHQEKIEAERHLPGGPPSDPQLTMPLIGEVRRPEPSTPGPSSPKRRRPVTKKPVQPTLGQA